MGKNYDRYLQKMQFKVLFGWLLAGVLECAMNRHFISNFFFSLAEAFFFVFSWVITGKWGLGANLVKELIVIQSLTTLIFTVDWFAFLIRKPLPKDYLNFSVIANAVVCFAAGLFMMIHYARLPSFQQSGSDTLSFVVALSDFLFNLCIFFRIKKEGSPGGRALGQFHGTVLDSTMLAPNPAAKGPHPEPLQSSTFTVVVGR
ncbi:hypothetical protein BTUL_0287g00070 [Botrytis tulipae]|uniref:Uncharacterized protein n=1 Tax=Botrytis tulipae TaxID=87230 RepID=A0A4Z1E5S0_9HELO|nr:hypothetical protein BTUL_0287g00070 [Botrytis tulipae]